MTEKNITINPAVEQDLESVDQESHCLSPICVEETQVYFLGVGLEKGSGGVYAPDSRKFERIMESMTKEDYLLVQQVAIALKLKQPILIESYSAAGKTTKVELMAALLNQEVHYANCHNFDSDVLIGKMTTDETTTSGFGWKDGVVTRAIRDGGILFLDEYNFMRGDVRGRLHEILDALIRGKDFISLTENHNEKVAVHPEFRLVAAQNPPGGEYGDREVLDPPQISRFVYIKGPGEMPKEQKMARVLAMFGKGTGGGELVPTDYMREEAALSFGQFLEIPGCEEVMIQFVEFVDGFEQLRQKRKIAADQSQPPYSTFPRDQERVCQYIQMFFSGDIAETMRQALRYYFKNRMEKEEDRQIVEEQINHIRFTPKAESRRRGLDSREKITDLTQKEGRMKEAKEIFGYHYFGPEAIKNTFGIEIASAMIPEIPFDTETLKNAEALGHFLILRIDKDASGPLTMAKMVELASLKTSSKSHSYSYFGEGYASMEELLETEASVPKGMTIGDMLAGVFDDPSELEEKFGTEDEASGKATCAVGSDLIFAGAKKHLGKAFFVSEMPNLCWALVSSEILPGTVDSNYIAQLFQIANYLESDVFAGAEMPGVYRFAINQFLSCSDWILSEIGNGNHREAASMLSELELTKLVKRSPAEVFYDSLIFNSNNPDETTLAANWEWTNYYDKSSGQFLDMGEFTREGMKINFVSPGKKFRNLGAYLSRTI
ncbi:MAG: AAA family ATPase [Candidatus Berkelbacteria bacterium]|nr:AAA family ATPase [Candidatus Berkelbacteria bacterium]